MFRVLYAVAAALMALVSPVSSTSLEPAVRTRVVVEIDPPPPPPDPNEYVRGNCESLATVFAYHGATESELDFFFGRTGGTNILKRESGCGLDTYNESTGDTGVCQITAVHSQSGYFWGRSYGWGGWTWNEFGILAGMAHRGAYRDDAGMIDACLFLLRGGSHEPGTIDRAPWRIQR